MEDVLDVYRRPEDPTRPVICLDETSTQVLASAREPEPPAPGQPVRTDYEYRRQGVVNVFMMFEPLAGRRQVKLTERRTKPDWAECIRELVDERYPRAQKIVLVMDNLNTHSPSSLYEAFEPSEAKRLADKLEIHYTPKHGSWLNMAEIELSILKRQCLDRRMGTIPAVVSEVKAWEQHRNDFQGTVDWQFTTDDARIKLTRLYPRLAS